MNCPNQPPARNAEFAPQLAIGNHVLFARHDVLTLHAAVRALELSIGSV
jgi:predicted nucleotidyltransferase